MSKTIVKYIFLVVFLFSGGTHAVDSSDSILVKGMKIEVQGDYQENLDSLYAQYIGKTISLNELAKKIRMYFIDQDFLYPQVRILSEGVEEGLINADVKFTYIGDVIIYSKEKDNELISEYIKKILDIKPAKIKTIRKYIALMRRIPGYQIRYEFRASKKEGAVDLALQISKSKGDIYISSDSYGDNDYGEMQNIASAQVYSPFGGNDSWSTYGVTTNHPDRLYVVGTSYSRIINNYGTSFDIRGSYSRDNSTYNNVISTKDGVSQSYGASFTHPLYLDGHQTIEGSFGTNYNYSKGHTADINISRNSSRGRRLSGLSISPYTRPDTEDEYWSADAGLRYMGSDKGGGYNSVALQFRQGIGGKFKDYSDPQDIVDEHYKVMKVNVYRDQSLPNNFSLVSNIMAGRSDDDLPDQETFSLGGRDFGRGYESGILSGNKIIAASLEIRYNKVMEDDPLFRFIQPYVFRDMGYIGKQYAGTNISHLSSYGGGIRFFLTHDAQVSVEMAQPLQNFYTIDGEVYEPKAIIGIMATKSFRF